MIKSTDQILETCEALSSSIHSTYVDFVFADPQIPIDTEITLAGILNDFESMSPEKWRTVRQEIHLDLAYDLWNFAFRMCILTVRSTNPIYSKAAAVALAIAAERVDRRDLITHLGILTDACARIDVDAEELLSRVTEFVNPEQSTSLKLNDRSGFKGMRDGNEFIYVQ